MIESQNSLYPREGQNGCGSKEACVSGLYRSPRVFHPQQKFGAAKFSLQSQSKQDIESHASDPHTNHVCNTYMSERSSSPDVFQTYPARESEAVKISPAKQSRDFLLAENTIKDLSVKWKYVWCGHASSSEDVCSHLALSSTKRLETGENLTLNSGAHS